MNKSFFIILSILIFSGCSSDSVNQANEAKERFTWSLVTTWPKNYPGLGMAPERFANLVDEMSEGRLKIKVFGAGELVPAMGVFDAVSNGSAEMGHGGAYYWKGKIPAAQFFAGVPFGLTADEINAWVNRGGGQELWQDLYRPFNLLPLPGGNTGTQMFGWFNKEIKSLEDIRGLKMRIPGIGGEVFQRAGGVPVNIPGGELYTALQTGTIDATEWVGPYNDLAFGFHQIADYYYYPGWHEPGSMLEFMINLDAWNKLPETLKVIVKTAAQAVNQDLLDEYTAMNNKALQELVSKYGVNLLPLPEEVLKEFKDISETVLDELAAEDTEFKKVYEHFKEFKNNVTNYHNISEDAFVKIRSIE